VPPERQLTFGSIQADLDANLNFSSDGQYLVADCRPSLHAIPLNNRLMVIEVSTARAEIVYTAALGVMGVGAASFLTQDELLCIHALPDTPYDFTARAGGIVHRHTGALRYLDSRCIVPPFVPGALRGGTHKHEPSADGGWVGFTYNDHLEKSAGRPDLRNVGVCRRGIRVEVPPGRGHISGEGFSVLLTNAKPNPQPGSDEFQRAEGDCWVGVRGFRDAGGDWVMARAFRGTVAVKENGNTALHQDVFIVTVPQDITRPGSGPLEGTTDAPPYPPAGAEIRRLTFTARHPKAGMRGVYGHLRSSPDGRWIAFAGWHGREGARTRQVFCVSPATLEVRRLSSIPCGVTGEIGCLRFSPDNRFLIVCGTDGALYRCSTTEKQWGDTIRAAPKSTERADNPVISPNGRTVAYNRDIDGIRRVFAVEMPL
jgi:hypothetical protein